MSETHSLNTHKKATTLLYASFVAGLCSIIYELLIATTVSYFLGDSVTYFSLTIGMYMASMGIGSYVSKYVETHLLEHFIKAELLLGVLGGLSIPALYIAYASDSGFIVTYSVFTILIGFLIGLEIPFLTRLMEGFDGLKSSIANILSLDYLGALIATLSFPFILLPFLGVYQSSLLFGLVNMSIGFVVLYNFSDELKQKAASLKRITWLASAVIILMLFSSSTALKHWDSQLYEDRIIHSEQTIYQKIVLTKHRNDIRLYLDGHLQFSSIDEYRYHESLVHIPISTRKTAVKRVLLLGAGDGLAVRELLKYQTIKDLVIVDLDPAIVKLAQTNSYVRALNKASLDDPRVRVHNKDAFSFLKENDLQFDMIIADLPDPNNEVLARLYSTQFYRTIRANLAESGVFVTQATSPYFAKDAFWTIHDTLKASGFNVVRPYHAQVPSFGEWGFVMAASDMPQDYTPLTIAVRFLSDELIDKLMFFADDLKRGIHPVTINTIDKPILLQHYLKGWQHYGR